MDIHVYYNPQCSKSKAVLAILHKMGYSPVLRDYLLDPLTVDELSHICDALEKDPKEIIRCKEPLFKELSLDVTGPKSRDEWLLILHKNPILIERPIVCSGDSGVIARPPEKVLDWIKTHRH